MGYTEMYEIMQAVIGKNIMYENYIGEPVLGKVINTCPINAIPDDFFVYIEDPHIEFNDKDGMYPNGQIFMYTELRRFSEVVITD